MPRKSNFCTQSIKLSHSLKTKQSIKIGNYEGVGSVWSGQQARYDDGKNAVASFNYEGLRKGILMYSREKRFPFSALTTE